MPRSWEPEPEAGSTPSASPGGAPSGIDARGSTQPVAALVAVLAVSLALSTYAVGLESALPEATAQDRGIAKPTLERVTEAVSRDGVVDPEGLEAGPPAGPDGYEVNVTVRADERTWTAGAEPPTQAETASRPVSVDIEAGETVPGRLRVEVWS